MKQSYSRVSDLNPKSMPFVSKIGIDRDIDIEVGGLDDIREDSSSWIDISEALCALGRTDLAMRAQKYAVPRLEHLIGNVRYPEFSQRFDGHRMMGERLIDAFSRRTASAVRQFAFLQRPANVHVPAGANVVAFGIERSDERTETLLIQLAMNAISLARESDGVEEGPPRDAKYVFMADFDKAMSSMCRKIVDVCEREAIPLIVMTSSRQFFDEFYQTASSAFISGLTRRADVGKLCLTMEVSDEGVEDLHANLFTTPKSDEVAAFALVKGWKRNRHGFIAVSDLGRKGAASGDSVLQTSKQGIADYLEQFDKSPYAMPGKEWQTVYGTSTLTGSWKHATR